MVHSFALTRWLLDSMNPGADSVYTSVNAGMITCPQIIGGAAARFGGGVDNLIGQSYRGVHRLR